MSPNTIDLDGYVPSPAQMEQAGELCSLLEQVNRLKLRVSLIGGYALDALYGRLTRDHKDFDFLVDDGARDAFVELLLARGYLPVTDQFDAGRRKEAYHRQGGSQAEFVVLDSVMLGQMAQHHGFSPQMDLFLPPEPTSSLLEIPVRIPGLAEMIIIDRVQTHTAAEKGWKPYAFGEHRALLIERLKRQLNT